MNGLPCSSLMTEAANGYVSIGFGIVVLADVTYPVTYQYLEGNKVSRSSTADGSFSNGGKPTHSHLEGRGRSSGLQTASWVLQIEQQKLQDQKRRLSCNVSFINALKNLKSRSPKKALWPSKFCSGLDNKAPIHQSPTSRAALTCFILQPPNHTSSLQPSQCLPGHDPFECCRTTIFDPWYTHIECLCHHLWNIVMCLAGQEIRFVAIRSRLFRSMTRNAM
jgi:hypothetical protein